MGMASGQARLLSITSRISDNELRAQLINNSKMRLASESSKVSEQYVTALNEARMMFTNYGPENTKNYQDLTFNAMTAYNQYNNQYGLSTMSGQLLVSERDANRFKAAQTASDPLNTFLESYGLKHETTFFNDDQLGKYMDNGQLKLGKYVAPDGSETQLYSKFTPEQYKAMYEGDIKYNPDGSVASGKHLGYEASFLSPTYVEYDKAIKNYNDSYANYQDVLPIRQFVDQFKSSNGGQSLSDIYSLVTKGMEGAGGLGDLEGYMDKTVDILNQLKAYGVKDGADGTSTYFESLIKGIQNFKEGTTDASVERDGNKINIDNTGDPDVPFLQISKDALLGTMSAKFVTQNADGTYTDAPIANGKQPLVDENGNPMTDDEGNPLNYTYSEELVASPVISPNTFTYKYHVYDSDGNEIAEEYYQEEYKVDDFGSAGTDPKVTIKATQSGKDEETRKQELYNFLAQTLTSFFATYKEQMDLDAISDNILNTGKFPEKHAEIQAAKDRYRKDAQALAKVIFGANAGSIQPKDYQNLIDLDWVQNHEPKYQDDFQSVIDISNLEELFDVYGEPSYSWIKDGKPDENAQAEAKWYTNLYNRMAEGYKVLEDGLASSKEWMRFALESGLVTMEQVDKEGNWTSTMYSNCSDITEQTDNLAVTKAEAQYKSDMSKVENKDKRYDMELKNIDTEHNSLQTEYDSIKSAIDKNIERTFKIYS